MHAFALGFHEREQDNARVGERERERESKREAERDRQTERVRHSARAWHRDEWLAQGDAWYFLHERLAQ